MGMSSSQARLLSLTGRMHDIELKAQRIQAQKLRLANESDKVYSDYINVLDAKKVQYRAICADGSVSYKNASLATLENGAVPGYAGEASLKSFLIKNASTNEIYVTEEFAKAYGISSTGDVSDPGSLEDYLTAHHAHQRDIMKTVTNYSDVQSVTPVENLKVAEAHDQLVNDPDTYNFTVGNVTSPSTVDHNQTPVYGLSGSYTPASGTAGSVSYNVTNNIPNTMSVTPYTETGNMIDVITTGGTPATVPTPSTTSGTLNVSNTTLTTDAGQTYRPLDHMEYNFNSSDISKTLSELFPSLSFTDSDTYVDEHGITREVNQISMHYGNELGSGMWGQSQTGCYYDNDNNTSNGKHYVGSTTLSDLLTYFASKASYLSFTGSTIQTNSGSGQMFYFLSSDEANVDNIIASFFKDNRTFVYGSDQTFNVNTKLMDYIFSNRTVKERDLQPFYLQSSGLRISGYDTTWYPSGDQSTLTYKDYLDELKSRYNASDGFDYVVNGDGSISISMNGNQSMSFNNVSHHIVKEATQTNTTTVNVSLDAIAENIYMMEGIINTTKLSDYNANHDSRVTTIKNKLTPAYGTNYRQLALLNDAVVAALNSGDMTQINSVYNNVKSHILDNTAMWNISSSDYLDSTSPATSSTISGVTTNTTVITHYAFTVDSSTDYTAAANSTQIPDGSTTINKGEIKNAPSEDDMEEFLAKAMFDANNSQSYEDYLNKLNSFSLSSYVLAILYNNRSNSDMISALVSSTAKSNVLNWIDSNLDAKYHSDKLNSTYYSLVNQSSSNQYTCTNTSTSNTATSPSRADIIKYLAYQMHSSYSEKTPAEWETYIAGKFGASGWNYSDKNVASISKNFAANSSDILSKLKSGTQLTSYINSFDDYSVTMSSSNNLSFSTTMTGTEEHYVNMDSVSDIATRLASDIYGINSSVNPNTVRSQIMSTFSNQQLASLSSYYGTANWNNIVNALSTNINASLVSGYLNNYTSYSDFRPNASDDFSIETVHNSHEIHNRGRVNIPKLNGIASNLVVAFRKAGYTVDADEVNKKLADLYNEDNDDNNQALANINDATCNYLKDSGDVAYVQNIYNNLFSGSALSVPTTYSKADYAFYRDIYGTCDVRYGTEEVSTGMKEWVHDDLYDELVSKWNSLKQLAGNKFVIVDSTKANSYEFVRNLICETGAFLLEFNNSITEMKETSVAVESTLSEVNDEKDLKKAEADYEAKMRRINQKDAKYDRELATCDTERNAIKQEMDTLKTVMKNNVDLSFKLFS